MVVIITKNINKKTKNFLKRWFIEPKANIFVGNLDFDRISSILEYIKNNVDSNFNGLVISSTNKIQKYKIIEIGNLKKY